MLFQVWNHEFQALGTHSSLQWKPLSFENINSNFWEPAIPCNGNLWFPCRLGTVSFKVWEPAVPGHGNLWFPRWEPSVPTFSIWGLCRCNFYIFYVFLSLLLDIHLDFLWVVQNVHVLLWQSLVVVDIEVVDACIPNFVGINLKIS